ncbi:MAG: hypothetical protein EOP83_32565, partial [Verrucomicrobiaceae bacterium]
MKREEKGKRDKQGFHDGEFDGCKPLERSKDAISKRVFMRGFFFCENMGRFYAIPIAVLINPLPFLAALVLVLPLAAETKRGTVIYDAEGFFRDDFRSGNLSKWGLSEDNRYNLQSHTAGRIDVVDAPGLPVGTKAVRFKVPRAPNSFRAEISTRHEEGFQERWHSQRLLVPKEWVPEFNAKGNDIVMQWHGIPGNWKATYPNLEISIGRDKWFVRQSFGSAREPKRVNKELNEKVVPGQWSSW